MLRRSQKLSVIMVAQGAIPVHNLVPRNQAEVDRACQFAREHYKRARYYGTKLQKFIDRELMQQHYGGPRGRNVIRKGGNKIQYLHDRQKQDEYMIDFLPRGQGEIFTGGGYFQQVWDHQTCRATAVVESSFGWRFGRMPKADAVNHCEEWGMRYILLDEYVKPVKTEYAYAKHSLYSQNFPYKRNPITNPWIGDADWIWKGDEKYDYSTHGATSKSPSNEFRSMWVPDAPKKKA